MPSSLNTRIKCDEQNLFDRGCFLRSHTNNQCKYRYDTDVEKIRQIFDRLNFAKMHPKEYSHKQMYSKSVLHIFLNEFPYYIKK
jgi:hypothetical protein